MINFIGKKAIVRCDRAGVFYGTIKEIQGRNVLMTNVRKIHYWSGAAAVEQIAEDGVKSPENCRITIAIAEMLIADWIQILPCSEKATNNLDGVKEWKVK